MIIASRERPGLLGRYITQLLCTFLLIIKRRIQKQTPQLSKQLDWTKALPIHRQLVLAGTNRQLGFT
jgi:hypothetical protein